MKTFEEHIKEFIEITSKGEKPEVDEEFIYSFTEFLSLRIEDLDIIGVGEGAYFGKQIVVAENTPFANDSTDIEIAYDKNNIVVYTARHNGFWVPPYISIKSDHPLFGHVRTNLINFIKVKMGLE
jgi:hypothetical protein